MNFESKIRFEWIPQHWTRLVKIKLHRKSSRISKFFNESTTPWHPGDCFPSGTYRVHKKLIWVSFPIFTTSLLPAHDLWSWTKNSQIEAMADSSLNTIYRKSGSIWQLNVTPSPTVQGTLGSLQRWTCRALPLAWMVTRKIGCLKLVNIGTSFKPLNSTSDISHG